MSKNIAIQEGGVGRQFTADKLKTALVGGGSCNWVPEDEVQLDTLSVSENGTYEAQAEGCYGFSRVVVNVPGGAGGEPGGIGSSIIGMDSDGNDMLVTVDNNGNIQTETIPSSIAVITPPDNPYGIYQDGATISPEGMVVKAYTADGNEFATVPLPEITMQPTTAVYDPDTDIAGGYTVETDMDISPWPSSFNFGTGSIRMYSNTTPGDYEEYYADLITNTARSGDAMEIVMVSAGGPMGKRNFSNGVMVSEQVYGGVEYTYQDKTVRWSGLTEHFNTTADIVYNPDIPGRWGLLNPKIPWLMRYGDATPHRAGSRQQITVSWPRPGDGMVLETTFEILVAPRLYTDDEENGNASPG